MAENSGGIAQSVVAAFSRESVAKLEAAGVDRATCASFSEALEREGNVVARSASTAQGLGDSLIAVRGRLTKEMLSVPQREALKELVRNQSNQAQWNQYLEEYPPRALAPGEDPPPGYSLLGGPGTTLYGVPPPPASWLMTSPLPEPYQGIVESKQSAGMNEDMARQQAWGDYCADYIAQQQQSGSKERLEIDAPSQGAMAQGMTPQDPTFGEKKRAAALRGTQDAVDSGSVSQSGENLNDNLK